MLTKSLLLQMGLNTFICTSGYCLMNLGHYLAIEPHLRHFEPYQNHILVIGYLATSLYSCLFCYSVPMALALCWISQIKKKIEGQQTHPVRE